MGGGGRQEGSGMVGGDDREAEGGSYLPIGLFKASMSLGSVIHM